MEEIQPHLSQCGYDKSRLAFNVETDSVQRIPLIAFAHSTHDSRSACVAVLDEVTDPEKDVASCKSVGAPIVFAYFNRQWQFWKQGSSYPEFLASCESRDLAAFFRERSAEFAPLAVYRAKTWARFDHTYQLGFVDLGLMPLVEEQAGKKLSELIERVVLDTKDRLEWDQVSDYQGHWLLKSSFWLLAAKILKDKRVRTFVDLDLTEVDKVFDKVAVHYGALHPVALGRNAEIRALTEAAIEISKFASLSMITIEALAYLYENALITKATRTELGTHSTPTYLVDYILGRLQPWIQELATDKRNIFEPACGHAAFLLSGMRLLSDLLHEEVSPSWRHNYLRARLHGCDRDSFALEIARLSLTLSDVPNPNGWDLRTCDIFESESLEGYLAKSTILLANPPFKLAQRFLETTIPKLRPGTVVGLVLPQNVLYSKQSRSIREHLRDGFEIAEISLFPDKVFNFSSAESAVILARKLESNRVAAGTILHRRIREKDFGNFRRVFAATKESEIPPSRISPDNSWSFVIPELEEVWAHCHGLSKFSEIATIGKGFDFRSTDDPKFPKGAVQYCNSPQEGFVEGFVRLHKHLQTHQLPKTVWINPDPQIIKTPRYGMTANQPQLLINYSPVSRGPWRLKALLDKTGHAFSSRFLAVRPTSAEWSLESLWGLCNSPLANAYVYDFSSKRDVLTGMLRRMPIPKSNNLNPLVAAVRTYWDAVTENSVLSSQHPSNELRLLHWQIDSEVLKLYDFPAKIERLLLNLFSGVERPGVPFLQSDFFPRGFLEPLRLRELLSLKDTVDWSGLHERRGELIRKKVSGGLSDNEHQELARLQHLADAQMFLQAPLPISSLEKIRESLIGKGVWQPH